MTSGQVEGIVRGEVAALESDALREAVSAWLVEPVRERRTFGWSVGETEAELWIFARTSREDVALAYSEEGFEAIGCRWGLVFVRNKDFGDPGGWYLTLRDLAVDSGYF